jgi:hypothetical protein
VSEKTAAEALREARERARLVASVPLLTITAEDWYRWSNTTVGPMGVALFAEIDALRAALAAEREAHAKTRESEADSDRVRERLAELLRGVANALKGPPPELTLWDWSDLPVVADTVKSERDEYLYMLEKHDLVDTVTDKVLAVAHQSIERSTALVVAAQAWLRALDRHDKEPGDDEAEFDFDLAEKRLRAAARALGVPR